MKNIIIFLPWLFLTIFLLSNQPIVSQNAFSLKKDISLKENSEIPYSCIFSGLCMNEESIFDFDIFNSNNRPLKIFIKDASFNCGIIYNKEKYEKGDVISLDRNNLSFSLYYREVGKRINSFGGYITIEVITGKNENNLLSIAIHIIKYLLKILLILSIKITFLNLR